MLASLCDVDFHAHFEPRLKSHAPALIGEEGGEHHAEAAIFGAAVVNVAVLSEVAVRLYGVRDSGSRVHIW